MKISTIKNLYRKYKTPKHVQNHMKLVAEVAVFLAKKIKNTDRNINIKFIKYLALLHDFLKMLVFKDEHLNDPTIWKQLRKKYSNTHDTEVASLVLRKIKEQKLAESIKTQQFDAVISKKHPLKTWEEKIVYYADKRVAHTKVVSLKERFREGSKRYGSKTPIRIAQKIYKLEQSICKKAKISPKELEVQQWKNEIV